MPEHLSVKERVELRAAAIAEAITDVSTVERWDSRQNSPRIFSALVISGDETCLDSGMGGDEGTTTNELDLYIELKLAQRSSDQENSSTVHNRWLARLEHAYLQDARMTEPDTGETLALDTRKTGSSNPPAEDNQPEFFTVLRLAITYDTYRNNPYAGPGITEKEASP